MLAQLLTIGLNKNISANEITEDIIKDENNIEIIEFFEKIDKELPEQTKKYYELYNYFCNNVVAELLKEDYL